MEDVGEAGMEDRLVEEDVNTPDRTEGAIAAGESNHLFWSKVFPGMSFNVILTPRTGLKTAIVGQTFQLYVGGYLDPGLLLTVLLFQMITTDKTSR